ncbi:GNAT family N-acetyltransferase [Streptomyces sp. NPDC091027]|uniref:GNAT family N-acetyltransferase n=1 Tax=Streptomyces sp. NPDC091027 TaxID=3365971 RepID=UPI003806A35F
MMRFRPANRKDTTGLAELILEVEQFYDNSTAVQPLAERRRQVAEALFGSPPMAHALVAEDEDGDLVGFAVYSFLWPAAGSSHSLFVKELFVRSALRRHGIGTRLMDILRALAAMRPGCTRVEWMTDRNNPGARSFYQSLGCTESDDKIVYRLDAGPEKG